MHMNHIHTFFFTFGCSNLCYENIKFSDDTDIVDDMDMDDHMDKIVGN